MTDMQLRCHTIWATVA